METQTRRIQEAVIVLNDSQILSYRKNGFLFPINVHDPVRAADVQVQWDNFEKSEALQPGVDKRGINRHIDQEWIWNIATDTTILDAVEQLIGGNILILNTRFNCKWPGDQTTFPWHQDLNPHKKMSPLTQVSAWYAIDSVDNSNGCLQYIPGSQRSGMLPRVASKTPGNVIQGNEENYVAPETAEQAVSVILQPGQVALHDGLTLHSSNRNLSSRRRCGLIIRYVPSHVRQEPGADFDQRLKALPARGHDELLGIDAKGALARMRFSRNCHKGTSK